MRWYWILFGLVASTSSVEGSSTGSEQDPSDKPRRLKVKSTPPPVAARPKSGLLEKITPEELVLNTTDTDDAKLLLLLGNTKTSILRSINLSYSSISATSFYKITQLNRLEKLTLRAVNLCVSDLDLISQITSLTFLDLSESKSLRNNVTLEIRNRLGRLPLESLRIEELSNCWIDLVNFLPDKNGNIFVKLKQLSISYNVVDQDRVCSLPLEVLNARKIKMVVLHTRKSVREHVFYLKDPYTQAGSAFHAMSESGNGRVEFKTSNTGTFSHPETSQKCFKMEIDEDYLNNGDWPNRLIPSIKYIPVPSNFWSIIQLDLSENDLNDKNIIPLQLLGALKYLLLEGNPVTGTCLKYLQKLPLLELYLNRTFITDVDIIDKDRGLLPAQKLRFPPTVKILRLSESLIEGACLQDIFKLPNLVKLTIVSTSIQDEGLRYLYACSRNIEIYVDRALSNRLSSKNSVLQGVKMGVAKFTIR